MSAVPQDVHKLVQRFERNRDSYKSANYNETQVRREFIDPLFKALGWDIDNEQGLAEAYKDVIHEDAIKVGGVTKAPDYCFRIGGTRKFFLEAKRPAVPLKSQMEPAYQLRRYAWSARLPLSILTDFEELAVYDCRIRPHKSDKPSQARTMYFTCDEYADRWDELASIFSKDAVLKGSFDRYAESARRKKGTAEVDAEFLKEIEGWREALARNFALRNPRLSVRDLNFAVQRTIDRIIFLRMCEDRGIEPYGQLQALCATRTEPRPSESGHAEPRPSESGHATDAGKLYQRLGELFRRADERYNSSLFYFTPEAGREPPDELTLGLKVDDRVLKDTLSRLYYPESPYEFAVLPPEILGQVYEQFLGKVIRLTKGHRAVVEDKPEVKKAGGVYYTPTYIVNYIVANTVGKLVDGKTPGDVGPDPSPKRKRGRAAAARRRGRRAAGGRPLRILDPACGSGSFLLGAYQYLLDWHRDWYVADGPQKHPDRIYQGPGGQWRLTVQEKKRILLNNIYGVDIDPQAVETTKLSLLLKVLENESAETVGQNLRLFHERALPDLSGNIKCGNSLIGPDFYDNQQMTLLDEEQRLRINVFDWQAEFPEVFGVDNPGFDAVIGNPPYVRQESIKAFKPYLRRHYRAFDSTGDLYIYFIERAVSLLRPGGLHGYIVSSGFLRSGYGAPLRKHLQECAALLGIVDFGGLAVFAAAKDTYVCVPLLAKSPQPDKIRVLKVRSLEGINLTSLTGSASLSVDASQFTPESWSTDDPQLLRVFGAIQRASVPLGEHVGGGIYRGIITGLNDAFELAAEQRERILREHPGSSGLIRRFLGGQDIRRYYVEDVQRFLIAMPSGWTSRQMRSVRHMSGSASEREAWKWLAAHYPPIAEHLAPFAEAARRRQDKGEFWWELRPCDYYDVLDGPKIIYPDIAKNPRFYLDDGSTWIRNTAYCLASHDLYLLGLLNSSVMWFATARISIPFGTRAGEFRYRMFTQYVRQLPVHGTDRASESDVGLDDRLVALVQQMLDFHQQLAGAKTPHEKAALQRQIDATDRQIDRLVYELYELTDDEIAIVEQATR